MNGGPPMGEWPSGHDPFEPGNDVARKHGAFSPRTVAAKCDELAPGFDAFLAERAPWAAGDEFAPMRLNYLRSLAVVELLTASVVETAAAKGAGSVPLRRFETLLASLRGEREALAQLGLTARTKAAMALDVASTEHTLQDLMAEGRRIIEAREAREAAAELPEVIAGVPGNESQVSQRGYASAPAENQEAE
jgi:hypothetical protein